MKRPLLLLVLSFAGLNAYGFSWQDLWSRPDQRAQALLDAGRPAEAIPLFADGQRKAYAEIRAQRYEEAAKRLQHFADPVSEYNRGNALARAGELPAAVTAYDLALRSALPVSSLYRDARHNRDLVARQLKSQSPPQSQQNQNGQGKNGAGQGSGRQAQGNKSPGNESQGTESQGSSPNQNPQSSRATDQGSQQSGRQDQNKSRGQAQAPSPSAAAQSADAQPRPAGSQNEDSRQIPNAKGDAGAEQAKRDASAALGQPPPRRRGVRNPRMRWRSINGCAGYPMIRPACCAVNS